MSDFEHYESQWGTWKVVSLLGQGSFGKVYKVCREEHGKTYYSAVKIISIPYDETEFQEIRSQVGHDEASLSAYFQNLVTDIINEIDLMSEFRGNSHIVSIEDHKVVKKTGEFGWDIFIRMELLQSLFDRMEDPLTCAEIIRLGIHICRALELCALKNIIHRDIKPDNIFISPYGDYKLGDFGVARKLDHSMSRLSKKGTYLYMAPEVFKGEKYGSSVDTYSLGILIYRFLNQNRFPFMPDFPSPIVPGDLDQALEKRMRGEPLPALRDVASELNALVGKACAYNRAERFADASQMREALETIMETQKNPSAIASSFGHTSSTDNSSTDNSSTGGLPESNKKTGDNTNSGRDIMPLETPKPDRKRKFPLAAGLALAALALLLVITGATLIINAPLRNQVYAWLHGTEPGPTEEQVPDQTDPTSDQTDPASDQTDPASDQASDLPQGAIPPNNNSSDSAADGKGSAGNDSAKDQPAAPSIFGTWIMIDTHQTKLELILRDNYTYTYSVTHIGQAPSRDQGTYVVNNNKLNCQSTAPSSPVSGEYTFLLNGNQLTIERNGEKSVLTRS